MIGMTVTSESVVVTILVFLVFLGTGIAERVKRASLMRENESLMIRFSEKLGELQACRGEFNELTEKFANMARARSEMRRRAEEAEADAATWKANERLARARIDKWKNALYTVEAIAKGALEDATSNAKTKVLAQTIVDLVTRAKGDFESPRVVAPSSSIRPGDFDTDSRIETPSSPPVLPASVAPSPGTDPLSPS